MSVASWNPFKELEDVLNKYHAINNWPTTKNNGGELTVADWTPKVDIKENKESYVINAELPGVKKSDVNVTLNKGILTIRGEKQFEKESDDEKTHRIERSYGSFVRSFSLPELVKEDAVVATFKEGLLNLVIPKTEDRQHKTIAIKVD